MVNNDRLIKNYSPVFFRNEILNLEESILKKGISLDVLVERASDFIAYSIFRKAGSSSRTLVLSGSGNNGKDAALAGKKLSILGHTVAVIFLDNKSLQRSKDILKVNKGFRLLSFEELGRRGFSDFLKKFRPQVVIDGIFGIGFRPPLSSELSDLLSEVNKIDSFKVAVDIPSGVDADSSFADENAFKADLTLTFFAYKLAHILPPAKSYCGKVLVSDLGFKKEIDTFEREIQISKANLYEIPGNPYRRKPDDHKKNHAVLIIAGSKYMPGACYFSAKSAMMAGASYVGIATEKEAIETVSKLIPEAVFHEIDFNLYKESLEKINELTKYYSSVLIGPGLSRNKPNIYFAVEVIDLLSNQGIKSVIDGDALFALSRIGKDLKLKNSVLTPHIGEAKRLLADFKDQLSASLAISKKFEATCVLKSSSTIVARNGEAVVFSDANCNLATAGSGDILAGIIAAFLSYDEDTFRASLLGVAAQTHASLHLFKKFKGSSILSSDIIESVRIVLKGLCGDYFES